VKNPEGRGGREDFNFKLEQKGAWGKEKNGRLL